MTTMRTMSAIIALVAAASLQLQGVVGDGGLTSSAPSCIHGGNMIESVPAGKGTVLGHFTPVRSLAVGDQVRGLGADFEPRWCTVAAVEPTGTGDLHGNFTSGHFVLRDGHVVTNGKGHGLRHVADKWLLMTDCPFGVDESGTVFSALSDFNRHRHPDEPMFVDVDAGERAELSFADHLLLHKVYYSLIRKTGGFWLNPNSYKDFAQVQRASPRAVDLILACVKSGDAASKPCAEFEASFAKVADEWLVDGAGARAARAARAATPAPEESEESEGSGSGSGSLNAVAAEAEDSYGARVHAAVPGLGHPGAPDSASVMLLQAADRDAPWHEHPAFVASVAVVVALLVVAAVAVAVVKMRGLPDEPTLPLVNGQR